MDSSKEDRVPSEQGKQTLKPEERPTIQSSPEYFYGWFVLSAKDGETGTLKWIKFRPKKWQEDLVDVKIEMCALDDHDIEALTQDWAKNPDPRCVGHQIVGRVVRVGRQAQSELAVGDQVIVGPMLDSCRNRAGKDCTGCKNLSPQECPHVVNAAGGKRSSNYCPADQAARLYKKFGKPEDDDVVMADDDGGGALALDDIDGRLTAYGGGLSTFVRVAAPFAFKVDVEDQELAGAHLVRLACGGLTAWSALKGLRAGPGVEIAVLHMDSELAMWAVTFAHTLRADQVFVLATDDAENKKARAIMRQPVMGLRPEESAEMFTDKRTGETRVRGRVLNFSKSMTPENWKNKLECQCANEMDVLICTSPLVEKFIPSLAIMMARDSTIVILDGKDDDVAKAKQHPALVEKRIKLTTSRLGSILHMRELVKRAWHGYLKLAPSSDDAPPDAKPPETGAAKPKPKSKTKSFDTVQPMSVAHKAVAEQVMRHSSKEHTKLLFVNNNGFVDTAM